MSGCLGVSLSTEYHTGVELAPDADGWKDELLIKPAPPVEFRWQDDEVAVEILNWARETTYFEIRVRNSADEAARMLVHGVSPGFVGHGKYVFDRPGFGGGTGELAEDRWIDLPARGTVRFWIDGLPWLDDPSAGDRIDTSVDIERRGAIVTCPIRFRVARVYRTY
jgi:hypothetical protein